MKMVLSFPGGFLSNVLWCACGMSLLLSSCLATTTTVVAAPTNGCKTVRQIVEIPHFSNENCKAETRIKTCFGSCNSTTINKVDVFPGYTVGVQRCQCCSPHMYKIKWRKLQFMCDGGSSSFTQRVAIPWVEECRCFNCSN